MSSSTGLDQAMQMLRRGERNGARHLLTRWILDDPNQASAWVMLAACVDEPDRRRYCLQRALALNPDLLAARRALESLDLAQSVQADAAAAHATLQDAADAAYEQPSLSEANPPEAVALPIPAEAHAANDPPIHVAPQSSHPLPAKQPASRRTAGARWVALTVLAILIAVAGLAMVVFADRRGTADFLASISELGGLSLPEDQAPAENALSVAPATLALKLAPTWTVTPSPSAITVPVTRPTQDIFAGFSTEPVASITPFAGYRRIQIGRSVEGRPIEVLRFGAGRKERMIIAGIHGGDEYNTILLANQFVEHLVDHPDLIPEGYTLYILPALNPDGAASGRDPDDRLNENGVDLNRNFDTNWRSSWKSEGCASLPGTAGAGPGSEPETQALKRFLGDRQIEVLINYHSAGLGVFPSGAPAHPDSVRLAQAIAAISNYAYPPLDTGCEYTGTLVDWAAEHGVIAAVDLELNSVRSSEFEANLKILELLLNFDADRPEPSATPTINLTPFATATRTRVPRPGTATP